MGDIVAWMKKKSYPFADDAIVNFGTMLDNAAGMMPKDETDAQECVCDQQRPLGGRKVLLPVTKVASLHFLDGESPTNHLPFPHALS